MTQQAARPFGKRNRTVPPSAREVAAPAASAPAPILPGPDPRAIIAPDLGAVFADLRREADETDRPMIVRDSLRAAMLAGLVVGCGLAGLDMAGIGQTFRPIIKLLAIDHRAAAALPVIMVLGLLGGARSAATSLLLAHAVLKRLGRTEHLAYALGGAGAALAFVGLMGVLTGAAPMHGWSMDALAGAAGGYFYRVFAGRRPA